MKRILFSRRALRLMTAAVAVLLFAGLWGFLRSQETPPELAPQIRDRNVMRLKLEYAQAALEAITTENFTLLATNAQKLAEVTRHVSWRIRHTREYERLTADFRRQTEAMMKAAKAENVDQATVAYFQMTVSCVTCHKYLRGRDIALPP